MSIRIDTLPSTLRTLARRIDNDQRVGTTAKNGVITLAEFTKAKALGIITAKDAKNAAKLEAKLRAPPPPTPNTGGGNGHVTTPTGFSPWANGPVAGAAEHAFKRDGLSDTYTLVTGKNGIKHNGELTFPVPPDREGYEIQNIDVSFHAPLRQWNSATKREEKPTYCTWFSDAKQLMRKFVDPNADNGNSPEIDNIHPENAADSGVLATAGKTIRVKAENTSIPASETAMTVQWVRVTYKPKNVETKVFNYRGAPLANREWKGKWIQPGQPFTIDVDPNRKVARVEIQWSDKPDDVSYDGAGKWAQGTVKLGNQVLGNPGEHVGSPEWQTFEGRGLKGGKLEISTSGSPLKVFEVRVMYER